MKAIFRPLIKTPNSSKNFALKKKCIAVSKFLQSWRVHCTLKLQTNLSSWVLQILSRAKIYWWEKICTVWKRYITLVKTNIYVVYSTYFTHFIKTGLRNANFGSRPIVYKDRTYDDVVIIDPILTRCSNICKKVQKKFVKSLFKKKWGESAILRDNAALFASKAKINV